MTRTNNPLEHARTISRRAALTAIVILGALSLNGCGSDGGSTGPTLSSDASLSALLIDTGTLTPIFSTGNTSYTASVPNGTPFEIVRATAASADAKITINGTPVASGSASPGVALAVGANTITVLVTAQDQVTTRAYIIVVTRASTITTQ